MLWIILFSAFVATSLLTYSLVTAWHRRQRIKFQLGNPHLDAAATPFLRKDEGSGPLMRWLTKSLSASGEWALKDMDKITKVRETLIHAGFRHPQAVTVFYGLRACCALFFPIPFLITLFIKGKLTPLNLAGAFAISAFGFFLPSYLLTVKVRTRQNRLDKALPDVLDLFVICMEAGLALNAALNRVADEIRAVYKDFYDELQITAAELRTGIPWDETFDNLGKRTGVQSVRSLVGLMIQSDRLGASISDALRNHGEFIRTQRMLKAEEKGAKLPLKLIFPLILCIFPAMFIVTVGPGVIRFLEILFPFFVRTKVH